MNDYALLADLHRPAQRQGPGGIAETRQSIALAGLDRSRPLHIADIGCGTGAAALVLAAELDAQITAVDLLPEFLDELQSRARDQGLADRINTLNGDMAALPFADESFDVIWSEGAIYNLGFEAGIRAWRRLLKPGGKLVVSEITWLTAKRPAELQRHWQAEYPQIDVASARIGLLERYGYSPAAYFALTTQCWLENYYRPLQSRFEAFLDRHGHSAQARTIVEAEQREIALYEQFHAYYGYGVYIASKCDTSR